MNWVVLIFALIFLLLLVLLSVPLTFSARGAWGPDTQKLNANAAWGWKIFKIAIAVNGRERVIRLGLFGIEFSPPKKKAKKDKTKEIKKTAEKKAEKKARQVRVKSKFNLATVKSFLNKELFAVIWRYLKKVLGSIGLRLQLNGVYGTDDPALTGLLAGLIAILRAERINLNLNADFSGPVIDLAGKVSGRIIPIAIIGYTMQVILTKAVRRLWWAQLKAKFLRKKSKEAIHYV